MRTTIFGFIISLTLLLGLHAASAGPLKLGQYGNGGKGRSSKPAPMRPPALARPAVKKASAAPRTLKFPARATHTPAANNEGGAKPTASTTAHQGAPARKSTARPVLRLADTGGGSAGNGRGGNGGGGNGGDRFDDLGPRDGDRPNEGQVNALRLKLFNARRVGLLTGPTAKPLRTALRQLRPYTETIRPEGPAENSYFFENVPYLLAEMDRITNTIAGQQKVSRADRRALFNVQLVKREILDAMAKDAHHLAVLDDGSWAELHELTLGVEDYFADHVGYSLRKHPHLRGTPTIKIVVPAVRKQMAGDDANPIYIFKKPAVQDVAVPAKKNAA